MTIKSLGAFYDTDSDLVYSFLSNGTSSYLTKTDKDSANWLFAEPVSTCGSATAFNASNPASFIKYGSNIIFTKDELMSGVNGTGGTFTLSTTGSIIIYGNNNNPTGRVLEVHKERIFLGNISYLSNVVQNGGSWTMVSKFLPEKTDTVHSIVNSGIIFGIGRAAVVTCAATFKAGDVVWLSGVIASGINNDLNQNFFDVVGTSGGNTIIEYNNNNDLMWSSGGTISLRGSTWSTANTIYEDALVGAGVFRCDDNDSDEVVTLKSSFGALAILKQQNPYIFTGALESGNASLSRALNIPYGCLSQYTAITAGGLWFISPYGLSKIEGTKILTNRNELDNIIDISTSEPIKAQFNAITLKNKIILNSLQRYILMHNQSANVTYRLDTLEGNWAKYTQTLVDYYVNTQDTTYSIYKHLLFKLEDGYQAFDLSNYAAKNISSYYYTKIIDFGDPLNKKYFKSIYSLLQGGTTSAATNEITFNIIYNGAKTTSESFSFNIKTGSASTWNGLTTNGTITWGTLTNNGAYTWSQILADTVEMVENRKYRLGTARTMQIQMTHSDNSYFRISRLIVDYDTIINTR